MNKIVFLIMLLLATSINAVRASNVSSDSTTQRLVADSNICSPIHIDSYQNNSLCPNITPQQQADLNKKELREKVVFWVTLISPIISFIMLLIAILQLGKQRSDSKTFSNSTNSLLCELNTLIEKHDDNAKKTREDRIMLLSGLNKGVCEINAQIFNTVLADITIQKQTISLCCDELCTLFRRLPNILKEGYPNQNPRVAILIDRIEKSTSTLVEMFKWFGSANDDSGKASLKLMQIVEKLKKEVGIATTKQQRELFVDDVITTKAELITAVESAIKNMRTKIEEYNA